MRWCGWFLLILVAVGWAASEVELPEKPASSARELDCWRRTRDGWERVTWLRPQIPPRRPALHPSVVGLLELLLSVTALVAFPARLRPNLAREAGPRGDSEQAPVGTGPRMHQRRGPEDRSAPRIAARPPRLPARR